MTLHRCHCFAFEQHMLDAKGVHTPEGVRITCSSIMHRHNIYISINQIYLYHMFYHTVMLIGFFSLEKHKIVPCDTVSVKFTSALCEACNSSRCFPPEQCNTSATQGTQLSMEKKKKKIGWLANVLDQMAGDTLQHSRPHTYHLLSSDILHSTLLSIVCCSCCCSILVTGYSD